MSSAATHTYAQEVEAGVEAGDEGRLGHDLGVGGLVGDDGDGGHVGAGRGARRGVDEVVALLAVDAPAPPGPGTRRQRSGDEIDHRGRVLGVRRVVDGDGEGVAVGQTAGDAQVAAEVDESRLGPADEEVDGDEVGGPAASDAAQVQMGAHGQGHAPGHRVEDDAGAPRRGEGHRARGGAGPGADLVERPVVAGLHHRIEDGRVEAVAGVVPARRRRWRSGRRSRRRPGPPDPRRG